ncbi:hypothetical protein NUM3379_14010 [Kineococcus sp. NUM-3379]
MRFRYRRGPLVLRDVDLAPEPGTVTLVRGGNGSGKTTLLRLAAGLLRPTGGTLARAGDVGYQPQTGGEAPPRLAAGPWLRFAAAPAAEEALDLLARLGGPPPTAPLAELSGGSLAKVLLAAALARGRELTVLDEPFAALDAASVPTACDLITRAAARGGTVLLADHTAAAAATAGRVLDLAGGALTPAPPGAPASAPPGPGQGGRWHLTVQPAGAAPRRLVVPTAERDRVLRDVLAAGGSVLGVAEEP